MTVPGGVAQLRRQVMERFARKLDGYLPESGELRAWTISEIERALIADAAEIARDVMESRIQADPLRAGDEKPRCPKCGRSLMGLREEATHKQTALGPIRYSRHYGYCRPCGAAFSPSGHCVEVRQGLL